MKSLDPYLNFPGNTEEAFNFYRSVFGGDFVAVVRFRDFPEDSMEVPENELDKIAHIGLPLGENHVLMGTDVLESRSQELTIGSNVYVVIETDSEEEAETLFDALASGGKVEMPLQQTEWAEKYGVLADRFGVQWMLSYTGNVQFSFGNAQSDEAVDPSTSR